MRLFALALVVATFLECLTASAAENWSQFRGPNAAGLAVGTLPLPTEIGPETNVVWKTPLPPGHSSPVVHGDRIYLTAVRDGKLLTIALDRDSGRILWERESPRTTLEEIHQIGSHAQSSPVTDGQHVVSFFGSSGLICHDRDGKRLWYLPMGPFKNNFGAGSSPILVDRWVILCQDHDTESFIARIDTATGETVWRVDRSEFPRNYASPVIWEVDGKRQIVMAATLRVVGYDFETGEEIWTVRGISRIVNMTPVVGGDGNLYVAAYSPGGDAEDRIVLDPWDELMAKQDANDNQLLERDEIPGGPLATRFDQIDRDKNGQITAAEYENMRRVFDTARNVVLAIKPGGKGEITDTHVLWEQTKQIPYVPSPLFHNGHLYLIKNGGILSSLDCQTGKPVRMARVSGTANYYASPVYGDGKIYLLSQRGELTIVTADPDWEEIYNVDFGDEAFATPALVDGRIYLRTNGQLYCFGAPPRP